MLTPIINHQSDINEIFKKMLFLRDSFNMENQKVFFEELYDLSNEMREELDFHFNLQKYGITNEKAKKFVLENMLVKEMLFRMLDFIQENAKRNSLDTFLKFEDFEEILKAYFKKERGLFIQQLKSVLNSEEVDEIEQNIQKLV